MDVVMKWLYRFSSWEKAACFLLLSVVLQATMLLLVYPSIDRSHAPLDTQLGINAETIQLYLARIGDEGRNLYFLNQATLDLLFPLSYALAYTLLLVQLIKVCGQHNTPLRYLALLPSAIALCDLLENLHTLLLIARWPELEATLVNSLVLASLSKHLLAMFLISALIVLLFWSISLRIWQQRPDPG